MTGRDMISLTFMASNTGAGGNSATGADDLSSAGRPTPSRRVQPRSDLMSRGN
jgi:hypothetical protein